MTPLPKAYRDVAAQAVVMRQRLPEYRRLEIPGQKLARGMDLAPLAVVRGHPDATQDFHGCIRQPYWAALAFVVASAARLVVAAYWENP